MLGGVDPNPSMKKRGIRTLKAIDGTKSMYFSNKNANQLHTHITNLEKWFSIKEVLFQLVKK